MGRYGAIGLLLAGGCGEAVEESPYASANLEAARVTPSVDVSGRVDVLGHLRVEPDGSGWEVTVTTPSAVYVVEVVSPGGADLSVFDGAEARVAVSRLPSRPEHSFALLTPEGEVLYLLEPAEPGALTESGFGRGLVGWGQSLGPVSQSGWTVDLWSARLRTDGAEVELLPGEPRTAWIRGHDYRVVLLSAWDLEEEAESCSLPASRLAFELVRVVGPVDETPLERDPAVPLVGASCEDEP